ncbi:peptide-binding protein [Blastopirellula retiformator]|uniref:Oligopeptide-binding protein AppA n=1 Tax=Blastopirellula retiformator TaxID=2527970 RepID=A0A5C5V2Y0_9BACT|nr:peptide-binding protein [Blastopirellula retiformator]TWT32092.1 Oligopeptide-binding protein AppA precursor [Blastopirellula retiformator]
MNWRFLPGFLIVACLLLAGVSGCGGSGGETTTTEQPTTSGSGEGETTTETEEPEEAETLLEPYDAPTLEELDEKVKWVDQPVVDPIEQLKKELEKEPALTDAETALSLKNDFPPNKENNEKILSALGRQPLSEDEVNYDATIVRHVGGDAKSTNPLMISSVTEFDVVGLMGIEVFGFDWNMDPLANSDYVVSWQTSEDGLYDKVVLRDDIYWSDGKKFTAQDVMFSFQVIMDPASQVPAVKQGTDRIRWVQAYDDNTIVYFHRESTPVNVWNINFPVIPKHIYEETIKEDPTMRLSKAHADLEENPVCGGPYMLVKHDRGQEIVLERREDFYMVDGKQVRNKPYFKTIRFRIIEDPNTAILALKTGSIEEMAIPANLWSTQAADEKFYEHNTKATDTEWVSFHICWNVKSVFFEDKRVRQAMSYSFHHEEMLNKLFGGLYEPAAGPFHPTSWMAPKPFPEPYKQDLDKAEELLDEAGWVDTDLDGIRDKKINGKKVRFEFSVVCPPNPLLERVCKLLKRDLGKIGVACNIKMVEFTALQQLNLDHNFEASVSGWGTSTDPYSTENIFGTKEGRNYGQYSNPEVDDLFEQGLREFDKEKRAKIYGKVHEILYEDQVYTWLFYRNSFYGFNKKLRGYRFSPRGPYNYSPGFSGIWAAE